MSKMEMECERLSNISRMVYLAKEAAEITEQNKGFSVVIDEFGKKVTNKTATTEEANQFRTVHDQVKANHARLMVIREELRFL